MATTIPGFPAAEVREGLRIPMRMSMPVDETQWPEFVIEAPVPVGPDLDPAGYPWDPAAPVVRPEPRRVRPICTLEGTTPANTAENFGSRQPGVQVVMLLDEEYALVEGFAYVNIFPTVSGPPVRYFYRKVLERLALDTVEIWRIEVSTEDVS